MFSKYKFDPAQIAAASAAIAASLEGDGETESAQDFAARIITGRLVADPMVYLQYGPYWWGVKAALAACGGHFGDTDDPIIRQAYSGGLTPHGAMVAGEQFRDYYAASLMAGTSVFDLGADDGAQSGYELYDADMEMRRFALAGGVLPDGAEVMHEPDEPILDVVVKFEDSGNLWTAVVDGAMASGREQAQSIVDSLQGSGRIGQEIDRARGLRADVLDSVGVAATVDLQARQIVLTQR